MPMSDAMVCLNAYATPLVLMPGAVDVSNICLSIHAADIILAHAWTNTVLPIGTVAMLSSLLPSVTSAIV